MNKPHATRLDDRLNAVLIAIAAVSLLLLTIDATRDDQAQSAATQQAATSAAPADPVNTTVIASVTADR